MQKLSAVLLVLSGILAGSPASAQSAADIETMLAKDQPMLAAVLREKFPDDYSQYIEGLLAAYKSGGEDGLRAVEGELMVEIRRKYRTHVASGPDDKLVEFIATNIEFFDRVYREHGPDVCGQAIMSGPPVLIDLNLVDGYMGNIDKQAALTFEIIAGGMSAPVARQPGTADDWGAVTARMMADGASEADLKTVLELQPGDPNLCPSMVLFLKALNADPAFEPLRAEFVGNMTP